MSFFGRRRAPEPKPRGWRDPGTLTPLDFEELELLRRNHGVPSDRAMHEHVGDFVVTCTACERKYRLIPGATGRIVTYRHGAQYTHVLATCPTCDHSLIYFNLEWLAFVFEARGVDIILAQQPTINVLSTHRITFPNDASRSDDRAQALWKEIVETALRQQAHRAAQVASAPKRRRRDR